MFDNFFADYGYLLLIPVAVVGFFFFLVVGAALWEKRPVQPYYVPDEGKEYPVAPAAQKFNQEAGRLKFTRGCVCHDGKGKLYRIRYDFWLSPDQRTLAVVGSGTLASIPVKGIWLWSRGKDGINYNSTNEIGEQEICTNVVQQTWPDTTFTTLLGHHQTLLKDVEIQLFDVNNPLAAFFDIRRSKADNLVEHGYARYLDEEKTVWKYTLYGALAFYFLAMWVRPIKRGLRSIGLVK
jgi:hypothetical protein